MTKLRKLNQIIISLTLISLLLFSANVVAAENNIVAKGSTTVLPISQACAEAFMDQNKDIDISVQGGGSGVGIASIIDGTCDIGNASRPIKEKEIKTAEEKGVDVFVNIVARDAIAVVLHPANDIDGLTLQQIKAIYTG